MSYIKKAGIIGGAVVGGIVGGSVSVAGHLAKSKFVDELGESIVDSAILTGSIAGELASGTKDIITGSIKKEPKQLKQGKKDLKNGGRKILGNYLSNLKLIAHNSEDIIKGAQKGDVKKVLKGTKTLAKIVIIGAVTVGAIKVDGDKSENL